MVFSDPSWNKIGENIPEEDRKIGAEIQDLFWSQFDTAFLNLTKLLETIKETLSKLFIQKKVSIKRFEKNLQDRFSRLEAERLICNFIDRWR